MLANNLLKNSLKPTKIIYVCFFAWFCATGWTNPLGNWDMLPYVGSVYSYMGKNSELRKHALDDIKAYLSEELYSDIVVGSPFRQIVATDDRAFMEQLPYRIVKPLYILAIALLGYFTGNMGLASVLVSSAGFLLIGISLYLLRPRNLYEPLWLLSVVGTLYIGGFKFILLAQNSTPDSFATGLMLMGVWGYTYGRQPLIPVVFTTLAVLARPDFGAFVFCFIPCMMFLTVCGRMNNLWLLISVAVPTVAVALCNMFFQHFSYKTQLIDSLAGPFSYPTEIDLSNFINIYLQGLRDDIAFLINMFRFDIFIVAGLFVILFGRAKYAKLIAVAALGNLLIKIVLFPNIDNGCQERYFFISYFLVLFALFNAWRNSGEVFRLE